MISTRIAGVLGAAVIVAGSAIALVHAQGQEPPANPPARHGRFGPDGPGGPGGPGGFFGRGPGGPGGPLAMLRGLDLTEEQRAQVRQIVDGHADELKAIDERMREARKAENDAVTAQAFDESAIRARSAELSAVMADAAVLHAKVHGEVFAVLTPEQQAKAAELKAQFQSRMEQFRERARDRMKERRQRRTAPPDAE
jgi:protein CpxP